MVVASLVGVTGTAQADVPRGGTIVEGRSIAGATLGDTLAKG